MGKLTLGIDVGTQSTKAVLLDVATGAVVGRGASPHSLDTTRPGQAEQDPEMWIEAMAAAIKQALSSGAPASDIAAIGVSGQQHGLVALDAGGKVIRPCKLWCDLESAAEAADLSRTLGWSIPAGFTATKVLWLKRHEPENFARLHTVLLPHDYVNFRLTGRLCMECGDASGTGVLDLASRAFKPEACAAVDGRMLSVLPPLVPPDAAVGAVTEEAARRFGVPAGIPVAPGGGDNMMAALGAGAVSRGRLVVSLGTSGTLFGFSPVPLLDPTGAVAPFCDSTGAYLPLVCTQNCTGPPEEVRQAFGSTHQALSALAAAEPPGCGGVGMLPYLTGERTPNWPSATGAIFGLRPGSLRPGVLYRAALEGATFSLLGGLKRMRELGARSTIPAPAATSHTHGLPPAEELRVVGGGSGNPLWRRILADAFQVRLRFPLEPEAAALGGALQAAAILQGVPVAKYVSEHEPPLAPETVEPDRAAAGAYEAAFAAHAAAGASLFGGR